ncbi:MAG: sigma-70 family RNA polymerase sigma factor [Phycisphaeraceae bacterium]
MYATKPENWVEAHADSLYRYAVSRVGQSHLAEDLVQDTLLAAMQARRSFRGDSQELTWLIGILRHKVLDHFRSAKTRRETRLGEDDDGGAIFDSWFNEKGGWKRLPGRWEPNGEQLLENQEFWAVFHDCMTGLPDRPRQAFTMKVLDDQESAEVCKELKITPTNFWVVLHRARALLRACLEKHWFTGGDKNAEIG